jgi:hypothetical protein
MNTFAFLTKDSFRIEVKATSPKAAYNKINSITHLKDKITKSFVQYNSSGLANLSDWKNID